MLVSFTVKNFGSIYKPVTISLAKCNSTEKKTQIIEKKSVFPVFGIYGANASGKSTLKNYHETGDYFDLLKPHMEDAISRAKKAKQRHLTAGKGELTLEFNPSSSVFELLDEIKRLQGYS